VKRKFGNKEKRNRIREWKKKVGRRRGNDEMRVGDTLPVHPLAILSWQLSNCHTHSF
jgi:hypothetical protein